MPNYLYLCPICGKTFKSPYVQRAAHTECSIPGCRADLDNPIPFGLLPLN